MTSIGERTLAEIVINDQRTARLFEKHHLDFSCNGNQTLLQACLENEINLDIILNELKDYTTTLKAGTNFSTISLTSLIQHITSIHHAYVKNEIPILAAYLEKITTIHKETHPELINISSLFNMFKEEMLMHLQKEELILFPRIKEIEKICKGQTGKIKQNLNYLLAPVEIMKQEHEHTDKILTKIRNLANNYQPPADACTTYKLTFSAFDSFEKDLHQHVHLENNILFPKAITLFKKCQEKF